ncbi:ABC transporter permease subunit [Beduinella massiliensis]|uniref:ABC transporter permease subunit n=1 Tax=Beduinella massiliensis TaxID=1852363 RepID=UPI000C82DA8A
MKNKNAIHKTAEDHVINTAALVVCVVVTIVSLYPIYYCLINSLNDGKDAMKGGIYLWPRVFSLENYRIVFREDTLLRAFFMTVARTLCGSVLHVLFTAMTAYALSRRELMFRKLYVALGIITMYVGGGIIPTYLLYKNLKLINTFWVYILPGMFSFYNMILMMSFFRQLPESLVESARIDGASHFTVFRKVILPLSPPIIATVALFVGVNYWNDWYAPAYYILDEELMTMPATLLRLMNEAEAQQKLARLYSQLQVRPSVTLESVRYATLIVSVMPITILYPFVQKYFIKGMMIGSVKE